MVYGWILIHGIEAGNDVGFSSKFQSYASRVFPNNIFYEINWKKYIQNFEEKIYLNTRASLKFHILRKPFCQLVGDAESYTSMNQIYASVHEEISQKLDILRSMNVDKIILVGHSLGTIIINNYLWDMTTPDSNGNLLHKCPDIINEMLVDKLLLIATMGSPLAIWAARYPGGGAAIDLNKFRSLTKHINIYSPYDIISWPISNINVSYELETKIKDISYAYGELLYKFTPISHTRCWDDSRLFNIIFREINNAN